MVQFKKMKLAQKKYQMLLLHNQGTDGQKKYCKDAYKSVQSIQKSQSFILYKAEKLTFLPKRRRFQIIE